MRRRISLVLALSATLAATCATVIVVTNTGLSLGEYPGSVPPEPAVGGGLAGFTVDEASQGVDLNGDGDLFDHVAHVWDAATGSVTNLGLDAVSHTTWALEGGWVEFVVREESGFHSGTDLNGDGDALDYVVQVYDAATGTTTNLGLSSTRAPTAGNGRVAIVMGERDQGRMDLNGDGDPGDEVLQVWDAATGTVTNLGYAVILGGVIDGDRIAFLVREYEQGDLDLDGDGDTSDDVVHVWDAATGLTTNLGVASGTPLAFRDGVLAFGSRERTRGPFPGTDLNGDGDTEDTIAYVWNAATGVVTDTGLSLGEYPTSVPPEPAVGGGLAGFTVDEGSQGVDLNGDGDLFDHVAHVWDAATGSVTNLGLDAVSHTTWALEGGWVEFVVREESGFHSGTDLNGDGDALDYVVQVYDAATGTTTNLGLSSTRAPTAGNGRLAISMGERDQGRMDLNGDGDTNDEVLQVWDAATGTVTNVGYAVSGNGVIDGDRIAFLVREYEQGDGDLDGDGDESDEVVHVWDAATGLTTNLGVASGSLVAFRDGVLAFGSRERTRGPFPGTDLDGDGDTEDTIAYVASFEVSPPGDLDDDGDVDSDDIAFLLADRNLPVDQSACGAECDLDGDGVITGLDARQLALLCTRPGCATE